MRWMMIMAVLVAAGAAELSFAQEKADTRTLWVYEGGWFSMSKDGSWYEMNEAAHRTTGKPFKYGEAKKTKEFIDLYDDSRRKYVRLFEKHAETLNKKGDWEKTLTGKWKTQE